MRHVHHIETLVPDMKGKNVTSVGIDDPSVTNGVSIFDAILYPNRSLPNSGFHLVMSIVIGANIVFGTYFFAIGAWPVLGFCGLDIFAVWLAFRLSYRQGRLQERVRITADEMLVARILPSGHETRWRLQPFWTRVHIERPVGHESQVKVTSKGGTLLLGSFLSPKERGRFADALTQALGRCRSENRN